MAALALVAITVVGQCRSIAMPDMAFLLYAADRVLHGARLYRDIVEINPPLIVALNVTAVWIARAIGVSDFLVYRLLATLVLAGMLLLCRRLMTRYLSLTAVERRYLLLAMTIAVFPLAGDDFGEREHLVLALLLPHLVLVAARMSGRDPARVEALGVGVLGGVALALKPHFVVAWVGLETFWRWRRSDVRPGVTPEAIGTVATIGVYTAVVVVATPEYLSLVRDLGPAYNQYLRDPFYRLLVLAPGAALVLFALLAAAAIRRQSRRPDVWGMIAIATIGCFLAGAAQQKGLRYHFYPSFALGFVLLAVAAADARSHAGSLSERVYGRASRLVLATLVIVLVGRTLLVVAGGGPADRRARAEFLDLVAFVREHAAGEPIGVLSYNIRSAFPLVNYAGVPLASRFPHLWLFPVVYWDALHAAVPVSFRAPEEMGPSERYLVASVREDLLRARPRLLLVLRPGRDLAQNGLRRLHYVRYFARDPAIAELFDQYQFAIRHGEYDIYQRVDPGESRTAPPPSQAPGEGDARLARVTEIQFGLLDGEIVAGVVVLLSLFIGTTARRRTPRGDSAVISAN
jgi:hypothetical protein